MIDSEFLEQSGHVDIISMGFVREDGRELYFVLNSFDTLAVARWDWLMKNVMPSIGHTEITSHVAGTGQPVKDLVLTDPALMSRAEARLALMNFVHDITPEWWAWYGAYDHVALCSLFGRMIDLPDGWPMVTEDIKTLHKRAGLCEMPKQPSGHHNALEDARFNVVRYNYLMDKLEAPELPKERTFIFAETQGLAEAWLYLNPRNRYRLYTFTNAQPDRARGIQISESRDELVILGVLSEELKVNLSLARRLV